MKYILIALMFIFSCNSFATGSITCKSKDLRVEWGASHMYGMPMITTGITVYEGNTVRLIKKASIVGYYVFEGQIYVLALDDNMNEVTFSLRYYPKFGMSTLILYEGKAKKIYDIDCEAA